jgi:hypothetical protein
MKKIGLKVYLATRAREFQVRQVLFKSFWSFGSFWQNSSIAGFGINIDRAGSAARLCPPSSPR